MHDTQLTCEHTENDNELKQIHRDLAPIAAKWIHAYLECSDEVQEVVREMAEIITDPATDKDDLEMAIATFNEALFPAYHNGTLGADLEELEEQGAANNADIAESVRAMNAQEDTFGGRVRAILKEKGMRQEDLASVIGVGQTAISMLLTRGARPQRKTVDKIAHALGVSAEKLWPTL